LSADCGRVLWSINEEGDARLADIIGDVLLPGHISKQMIVWQLSKSISEKREMTDLELVSFMRRLVDRRRGSGNVFSVDDEPNLFGAITKERLVSSFFSR